MPSEDARDFFRFFRFCKACLSCTKLEALNNVRENRFSCETNKMRHSSNDAYRIYWAQCEGDPKNTQFTCHGILNCLVCVTDSC